MQFELTREYLDELREAIEKKETGKVKRFIEELHPADIAEIYGILDLEEARYIHLLLEREKSTDVLVEIEEDTRKEFLHLLPSKEIAKHFSEYMDSDDAADIIGQLNEEKQQEVLSHIKDIEQAGYIVDLLNYDEDTAGGLMGKELIKVNVNWSLTTCLREMRKQTEEIDQIYFIYVVDDDNILKGTLSLKKLLMSPSTDRISSVYNPDVIYARADASSEEVANIMQKYDLVALPVVDSIGRLIGRITIDDVVDVIREEAEKDYQMVSGITEDVQPFDKVWVMTRARLPWLLIGLLGGIFGDRKSVV